MGNEHKGLRVIAVIEDQDVVDGRKIPMDVWVSSEGIEICPEGYDTHIESGSPIFIDCYDGKLRVSIWGDINQEDPTHSIFVDGAMETSLGVETCKNVNDHHFSVEPIRPVSEAKAGNFIAMGDIGTAGIPSKIFYGPLGEIVASCIMSMREENPDISESKPLGNEGEFVFYLFEADKGGFNEIASAETIDELRGWLEE